MGVYILYPTNRFVAQEPPVNFFVRPFGRTDAKLSDGRKNFGRKKFGRKDFDEFFFDEKKIGLKNLVLGDDQGT